MNYHIVVVAAATLLTVSAVFRKDSGVDYDMLDDVPLEAIMPKGFGIVQ